MSDMYAQHEDLMTLEDGMSEAERAAWKRFQEAELALMAAGSAVSAAERELTEARDDLITMTNREARKRQTRPLLSLVKGGEERSRLTRERLQAGMSRMQGMKP